MTCDKPTFPDEGIDASTHVPISMLVPQPKKWTKPISSKGNGKKTYRGKQVALEATSQVGNFKVPPLFP